MAGNSGGPGGAGAGSRVLLSLSLLLWASQAQWCPGRRAGGSGVPALERRLGENSCAALRATEGSAALQETCFPD